MATGGITLIITLFITLIYHLDYHLDQVLSVWFCKDTLADVRKDLLVNASTSSSELRAVQQKEDKTDWT